MRKFDDKNVHRVFTSYPAEVQEKLLFLRELIFRTAEEDQSIGLLEETLKWGEPAYLTTDSKSGSTIRIGWKQSRPERYALFFNCKTRLIDTCREIYPDTFKFEKNRAIWFQLTDDIPAEAVQHCILLALTYHRRKKLHLLGA